MSEDRRAAGLLEKARAGDPEALGELYRRHSEVVYRIALHITGAEADAQDVVQDVFVGLPEALARLHNPLRFEAWLRTVTTNLALTRDRSRRRRRELTLSGLKDRLLSTEEEPVPVDRFALQAAIDRLPPPYRAVFVLREVEGFSHAEIARMLGISPGASEVRFHRARESLRRLLKRER